MPNHHRLAGRFFCVLITLALTGSGFSSSLTLCQISDTVYLANGNPAQGEMVILWSAFTTGDGQPIAAGELAVQGAQPLAHNGYKIPLMRNLVKRAIRGEARA